MLREDGTHFDTAAAAAQLFKPTLMARFALARSSAVTASENASGGRGNFAAVRSITLDMVGKSSLHL